MSDFYTTLKNSPMFQLSLASKELFHSNFLAWVGSLPFDKGKEHPFRELMFKLGAIHALDDSWGETWYVAREYMNFDLCVLSKMPSVDEGLNPQILLVLENKVKSIPYKEQLDKYFIKALSMNLAEIKDENVDDGGLCYLWQLYPEQVEQRIVNSKKKGTRKYKIKGSPEEYAAKMRKVAIDKLKARTDFILLSMSTDFLVRGIIESEDLWKVASYDAYLKHLKDLPLDGYNKLILDDYCTQMTCIQKLHSDWMLNMSASKFLYFDKDDDGKWIFSDEYLCLKELRIHDLYHKQRQASMCDSLQRKLDATFKDSHQYLSYLEFGNAKNRKINIHMGSGLIHGVPVLDLWLVTGMGFCFMIQVQGDRYQHGFRWLGTKYRDKYEELWADMSASYPKWIVAPDNASILDIEKVKEKDRGYDGRYNNKDSTDVYRYWPIKSGVTVEEMLLCIVEDFKALCKCYTL